MINNAWRLQIMKFNIPIINIWKHLIIWLISHTPTNAFTSWDTKFIFMVPNSSVMKYISMKQFGKTDCMIIPLPIYNNFCRCCKLYLLFRIDNDAQTLLNWTRSSFKRRCNAKKKIHLLKRPTIMRRNMGTYRGVHLLC